MNCICQGKGYYKTRATAEADYCSLPCYDCLKLMYPNDIDRIRVIETILKGNFDD